MDKKQELQITQAWCEKAIMLMKANEVPAMPDNYSIWFEYVRGGNKQLKAAIDDFLKQEKPFTREISQQIYNAHVLKELNNKVIEEASSKVQQVMETVLNSIEGSSSEREGYGSELESYTEELQSIAGGGGDVSAAINKIVERTKDLKKKGDELNKKLEESQKEVATLKLDLEEVSMQVSLDGLTGIANRKAFDEAIKIMMAESKETGKDLCLLMIDVDHFKKFNDTYGHLLGDQVLRIVSGVLKDTVRGKDFVARYGGEEFVVLLPETPLHGAQIVAENLRKTIAARELKRKDTGESYGTITVSIGVSQHKFAMETPEEMIERADKALYGAKERGRNMVNVG